MIHEEDVASPVPGLRETKRAYAVWSDVVLLVQGGIPNAIGVCPPLESEYE